MPLFAMPLVAAALQAAFESARATHELQKARGLRV